MSKVYEIVTNQIMHLLEQGEIPWLKPWKSSGGARNLITGKPYRGINQFLLNCSPYQSPYWLTFRQIQGKFGSLKKGSKSQLIVFWKWIDKKDNDDQDTESTTGKIPLLRYYNVFNLEQTEGISHPPQETTSNPFTPIEQAEQIIENMQNRPDIQYGGDRACYSPMLDYVKLPTRESFHSPESFYATAFHELIHSTGHEKRIGRKGIADPTYFGGHAYSQEELVAEFGASMLAGIAGIEQETIENQAAYIQGWLRVLKGDKKLAIIAAGQAQRAADYILNNGEAEIHL
ncbi:ArdC family protein [Desulfuromonas sp. TF]|uniref:ArdC family protein n=1 Tax=Desulfuromonas sp. TF TaxID=1232410 RepID=UPI00042504D4|nr:zincin-like metallopeptidase domain-containing protein [Desulfuromonas sp. TF]